ncbi:winged helix-turn-helix transcriptional regulator [Actinokineospora bangkokensis]|uniref:HTH hxlR-type domain-containing protein n=1 Tax=Actinokineospora bangkokensis TaxID=1193682 RepID=A0A1Q9LLY5_9PSEU|nr:helix-turn-helix domain-containing protein [Actinokineospora bangkokensis]OLR93019.1 hypothetical protein BJP25_18845 [Actinokineospora bangkokensis]
MPLGKDYRDQPCSLARALEDVGERWTLLILRDVLFGITRFSDLRAHLDIPRAVLADRLAAMVAADLLDRRPYAAGREEYHPTAKALDLWPVLHGLLEWGERHHPAGAGRRRVFRHLPCHTPLDARGGCPECGTTPPPSEVEHLAGPGHTPRADHVSARLREPRPLLRPVRDAGPGH